MVRARFALVMVPALATMSAFGSVGCSSEVLVTDTGSPSPSASSSATTTPTTTPTTPARPPEAPKKSYVRFLHSGFQYADNAKLCLRKDGETTYTDFTKSVGISGVPQGSMTRYVELAAGTYFAVAANSKDGCPTADPTRPEPTKVTVSAGYATIALYGNGGYTGEFGPHVDLFVDDVTAPETGRKIRALHFGVTYSQAETLYSGSTTLFPDMKFGTAPKSSPMGTVNTRRYLLDTNGKVTDVNAGGIRGVVPKKDKGVYTAVFQGAKGSGFFPLHVLVCPDDPTSESPLVTCE
jgi:hypothetical protein